MEALEPLTRRWHYRAFAGWVQGVEAAAALRALASDQLHQVAGCSGDSGIRGGEVTSTAGGIDAAEARLLEIRERYACPYPQYSRVALPHVEL
eukprot:COSAG02_NODE_11807_length_1650_cov_2.281875_3_plen_93_part_00